MTTSPAPNLDKRLSNATKPDAKLVQEAVSYIQERQQPVERARLAIALDVGRYLLKMFFDGSVAAVSDKSKSNPSFRALCRSKALRRLGLSRMALCNYIRVSVQEDAIPSEAQSALGLTHRIRLLPLHDVKKKADLALQAAKEGWSVRRLEAAVAKALRPDEPDDDDDDADDDVIPQPGGGWGAVIPSERRIGEALESIRLGIKQITTASLEDLPPAELVKLQDKLVVLQRQVEMLLLRVDHATNEDSGHPVVDLDGEKLVDQLGGIGAAEAIEASAQPALEEDQEPACPSGPPPNEQAEIDRSLGELDEDEPAATGPTPDEQAEIARLVDEHLGDDEPVFRFGPRPEAKPTPPPHPGPSVREKVQRIAEGYQVPFRSTDIADKVGETHQKATSCLRQLEWPNSTNALLGDGRRGTRWLPVNVCHDGECYDTSDDLHEDDQVRSGSSTEAKSDEPWACPQADYALLR